MRRSMTAALRMSFVLFLLPSLSFSQVPRIISYQGVLTDSLGTPKPDGSYSFVFQFYKAPAGGSAIWSEAKSLPVQHGLFSTMLGDTDPFPDSVNFTSTYWLSVQVGPDELAPRIQLGAVGYAIHTINADTAKFVLNAGSVLRPISPGISNAELADNAVTSSKIQDGSIVSADVNPGFIAPKADTALVALTALTSAPTGSAGGDLTGSYPNPGIAADAVTSSKIADGTIATADVASNFKSPKADTADYALAAIPAANSVSTFNMQDNAVTSAKIVDGTVTVADLASGFIAPKADTATIALTALSSSPSGSAGGDLSGSFPNPTIADSAVTTAKIMSNAVTDSKIAGMSASKLTGALPALDGSSLTDVNAAALQGNSASAFAAAIHGHAVGDLSGILPLANGGTGSSDRNFIHLSDDDTVRGSKVFSPTTNVTGLVVRRTPIISEVGAPPAFSVTTQDGSTSLFNVAWNGVLSGYASGLTGLNASELGFGTIPDGRLSGSYSAALTLSNVSNSFSGDGSGLTNLNLTGTYSNPIDLASQENNFTGRSLSIDDSTLFTDKFDHRVGIRTASPISSLDIQGSLGLKVATVTAVSGGVTVNAGDESVYLVNSLDGAVTINLPQASTAKGRLYFFRVLAAEWSLDIKPNGSELIDGVSVLSLNFSPKTAIIVCDGSNWYTLSIL